MRNISSLRKSSIVTLLVISEIITVDSFENYTWPLNIAWVRGIHSCTVKNPCVTLYFPKT